MLEGLRLAQVVRGYFAYHAVPTNAQRLAASGNGRPYRDSEGQRTNQRVWVNTPYLRHPRARVIVDRGYSY